jgi:hypothetical protein
MRKDLALLIVDRMLRSYAPRLLFHVAGSNDDVIDVVGHVQLAVVDLLVRVTRSERDARSGPQAQGGGPLHGADSRGTGLTGAEGDMGSLGDLLTVLPYDTMVTVGGPPRTGVNRGVDRRKKSK